MSEELKLKPNTHYRPYGVSMKSKHEQIMIWLIVHRPQWEHIPLPKQPAKYNNEWVEWKKKYNKGFVEAMVEDGVLSENTYYMDVNISDKLLRVDRWIEDVETHFDINSIYLKQSIAY